MQSTPLQTEPAPQSDLPAQKKAYHSPNVRAAGSVRNGTVIDGVTSPISMYTGYMSPI